MAFVNEYISDLDVKKYDIDKLWLKHRPWDRKKGRDPGIGPYQWTVDKNRDVFLMYFPGRSMPDMIIEDQWAMYWKGKALTLDLKLNRDESSMKLADRPFRIVYEFAIDKTQVPLEEAAELVEILKEALTVFGYDGPRKQIPETVVSFKF